MSNEKDNGAAACVGSLSFNGSERRLEGKVAIITGGAMGIGEAIVRLFTKHGAKVIIADFADEAGKNLAEHLSPPATYVHCDVSKEQDIRAVVDLAIEKHGQLDIMYNNAGICDALIQSAAEYDMEQFDRVMSVNVRGVMLGIKHAARVMIPRKKGCIISTGSLASMIGGSASHSYTASKHAVIGLTKNGAAELGKYGIRVNAVSPSAVATPLGATILRGGADSSSPVSEKEKATIEDHCNRIGNLQGPTLKVEDIAMAGLYLASDEAKYVSGHNLAVDGGLTVVNHSWGLYRP
jgi:NAD(P)-dependent dehydrogenase (short-subunit alcohol dehydrogenase family)